LPGIGQLDYLKGGEKMKDKLQLFVVILIVLLFGVKESRSATISVGDFNAIEGNAFSVDILISNVDLGLTIAAFEFDLDFDPLILNPLSVSLGSYLPSPLGLSPFIAEQNITAPDVNFAASVIGIGGGTGNGVLASILFEALDIGTSILDLNDVKLSAPFGVPISFNYQDGTANVTSSAVPEPSSIILLISGIGTLVFFIPKKL
jgi:hypothetical protein